MTLINKDCVHIGILVAMKEVIGEIVDNLNDLTKKDYGDLTIYS